MAPQRRGDNAGHLSAAAVEGRRSEAGAAEATEVERAATLRAVFEAEYVPRKIEDPTGRNIEGYRRALTYWERLTGDPPLGEIDGNHRLLSDFKAGLSRVCYRCVSLDCRHGAAYRMAANTQRKVLMHVQWVLAFAGPPTPPRNMDALGLIERVPYTKPPRYRRKFRTAAKLTSLQALWRVLGEARVPHTYGTDPAAADQWRAFLTVMRATSLRYGQLVALPWSAVFLAERLIVLPERLCRKSAADEPHPLTAEAVRYLLPLRVGRERVFDFRRHDKSIIYKELHRLQRLAGAGEDWAFHDVRRMTITELSRRSPAAAQLAAGHSAYATTQLYQDIELLADAVDHLPPLDIGAG